MRRSRIKVMATVPARRKPIKDIKDEKPDLSNSICNEMIDDEKPTEIPVSCSEDSKETLIETISLLAVKHEKESIELQKPCTPRIIDIDESNNNEEPPSSSETPEIIIEDNTNNDNETLVQNSNETNKSILEESPVCDEKILEQDNNAPASGETKVTSGLDSAPIAKISQTRTSFMRPTPRLDGVGRIRRNSVQGSGASASESEDDCRRATTVPTNRMRNDSASSMQSPKVTSRENSGTNVTKNSPIVAATANGGCATAATTAGKNLASRGVRQKRKMNVSESARKLAEARREFLLKYEHKKPDRAKLTMYDLIYYNPVTNPIAKSEIASSIGQRNSSVVATPPIEEDEEEEDDCEAMPVPQVKVGPDGHLVLDEQSLVIENTGAKKSREALARTEALVDEDNNGNGFYKKRQKTRDWPKWETLKFYKALNTVGTDFLLMQSLFPQRTRQEIKMKFKKEEKINRRFVEKALMYHQEFDIDSLKEDLATFEETESQQSELVKSEKSAARQGRGPKRKKNKSRRMAALSIAESNEEVDEPEASVEETMIVESPCQESSTTVTKEEKRRSGKRRSVTNEARFESECTSSSDESASDTEIYQIKPTRSGRMPKVRKLQAPAINTLDNLFSDPEQDIQESASPDMNTTNMEQDSLSLNYTDNEETTIDDDTEMNSNIVMEKSQFIENSISDIAQVEPGSLVIVSRESTEEPGETVLQVYMVSSEIDDSSGSGTRKNMTPVILTPELLNTVTAGITKVAPININND